MQGDTIPKFPDANDPPDGGDPIALTVDENSAAGTAVGTVVANEPDGDTLTYTVSGTDNLIFARTFDYNTTTGEITVKTGAKLDHEIKGAYSISVAVTDGEDDMGVAEATATTDDTVAVTITVTDVAETEIVALSYADPWADVVLIAGLDGDDDDITALTWSWQRSQDGSTNWGTPDGTAVDGNNLTTSYTPTAADVGYFIRATASYMENSVAATATAKTTAAVIAKPACDSPANILGAALGGAGYPADIWSDGRTIWVSMHQQNADNPELNHPILTLDLCAGTRLTTVPTFYIGPSNENEEAREHVGRGSNNMDAARRKQIHIVRLQHAPHQGMGARQQLHVWRIARLKPGLGHLGRGRHHVCRTQRMAPSRRFCHGFSLQLGGASRRRRAT